MSNEAVKQCYKFENDDDALACLRKVIKEGQNSEGCQPRMVLLVSKSCEVCAGEKAHHQKDIQDGIIKVVDIDTQEGAEIAKRNDILGVPAVLVLDCNNLAIE